jgi:xylose isomerase
MDVKAIRTQPAEVATKHLRNSLQTFLRLVEIVRSLDQARIKELISARDYEELDWFIINSLLGTH